MILLDTNVLVYASDVLSPQYSPSKRVVDAAILRRIDGVIIPQVLVEFVAATTGQSVRFPLSVEEASTQVEKFSAQLKLLVPPPDALGQWLAILRETGRAGRRTFDSYLAAQARALGITTVCTYNVDDFRGIDGMRALRPDETPIPSI